MPRAMFNEDMVLGGVLEARLFPVLVARTLSEKQARQLRWVFNGSAACGDGS